jgi:diaminopimelate epimerase
MRFTKMQGLGNDYVYVDCFRNPTPADPSGLSKAISDRHFGVGSDGLILITPSDKADARMRMFNSDGSEAEMCGNGVRCVAKYVYDHGLVTKPVLNIETGRGILVLHLAVHSGKVSRVRVDMGAPILQPGQIPVVLGNGHGPRDQVVNFPLEVDGEVFQITCVSMGNPHCVIHVPIISDRHVLSVGPKIENHPMFPRRTNVEFVEVRRPDDVAMRVWERGSGETLACGTGACAVAVAGVLTGRTDRRLVVHLRGGDLDLEWSERDSRVYMSGPAVEVFSGDWPD